MLARLVRFDLVYVQTGALEVYLGTVYTYSSRTVASLSETNYHLEGLYGDLSF